MDCQSLQGLRVYQDMVLSGETVVAGRRDCQRRWDMLAEHVPSAGGVLDVGSNLGWFGLKVCETRPECVVASVEPDLRSAALQRRVLRSHGAERICLLVDRADARMARGFARAGQVFDAVLCLSVLHWLPDHRAFLSAIGTIARRVIVEQPDPRESGAGFARLREEIGPIGPYLRAVFPDRPMTCLGQLPSHRECPYPREMWLVGEPPGSMVPPSPGLEVAALLGLTPSWPPRSWWLRQWAEHTLARSSRVLLTPRGLRQVGCSARTTLPPYAMRRLPENHLLLARTWLWRRARRLGGKVLRRLRIMRYFEENA